MGAGGGQDRGAWTSRVLVPVLLAGYVAVLYATTVLVGRTLVGGSPAAGFALTVLAAAVAALTLDPLAARLRRRLPVLPQDRLARLARGALAAADLSDVLRSTGQLLQEGLGATSVEITVGAPTAGDQGTDVVVSVLERAGTTFGVLRVTLPPGTRLSPRDQALLAKVAEHLTTILQEAALRDALRTTVAQAELRVADLRLSRQRIVLAWYEGRRKVERDIHDGAQQHLVALAVHLGLLRSLVADRPSASTRPRPSGQRRRPGRRWPPSRSCPTGSTPPVWPSTGSASRWSRRAAPARCVSRSTRATCRAPTRTWRPRSTSAAWRRCRTRPSMPERPGWTSASSSGTAP